MLTSWSEEAVGLTWTCIEADKFEETMASMEWAQGDRESAFLIAGGPGPRGVGHCVVVDGYGHLVHDPHWSGLGLARIEEFYLPCAMEEQ